MGWAKYLIIGMILSFPLAVHAQENSFATADSVSKSLYDAQQWNRLVSSGNEYIKQGVDFPLLHLRMGYAEMNLGNYADAISDFEKVTNADAYNQTARYNLYLCNRWLNRDVNALYHQSYIDSTTLKTKSVAVDNLNFESSFKIAGNDDRGNSFYTRAGISIALFKKLQLDQSVSWFKQFIYLYSFIPGKEGWFADQQSEYFVSPQLALSNDLVLFGGYHYMRTDFNSTQYNSNIGTFGLNYSKSKISLEGEFDVGNILSTKVTQYNTRFGYYPLGNLNLYFIGAPTVHQQDSKHQFVYNQLAGFKALRNLWLETCAVFGNQDNYIDGKGLYVYNAYDKTKLRVAETAYYQFGAHALAQISYTYEKKEDEQTRRYNQHSITAGIQWKF